MTAAGKLVAACETVQRLGLIDMESPDATEGASREE